MDSRSRKGPCLPLQQASQVALVVKNLPAGDALASIPESGRSPGGDAWRIPWIEEPGGLQSTGLQRVGHD